MKGSLTWTVILSALLLSISQNSIAAIGTITDQTAAVPLIQRSKATLQGTKGTGVEMADQIKTTQGKAGIKFADNTLVQVNENSKLVIDEFVYDPKNKSSGKLALNMASGTVRYASGAIAKNDPSKVAINTPTATIAVRGTDFTATVDELGRSTIILLPSCPPNWKDVERDCKTGAIEVITEAGKVLLDRPFQATKVEARGIAPLKPVTVNLNEDAINNLLIVVPPKEFAKEDSEAKKRLIQKSALDVDFLAENHLVDELAKSSNQMYQDKLSRNFLDQDFLANVLDIINAQMAAQLNLLNTQKNGLLPDYVATTGVVVAVDELQVELCRNDGSNQQCVTVPKNQNTTITQIQGTVEIRNRVNQGGTTNITLRQN